MRKYFRELVLEHKDRPSFIFGGGRSGLCELVHLRERFPDAIKVSANLHGEKLMPCDYIVFVDEDIPPEYARLGLKTPTISYHHTATYKLVEYPQLTNSGQYALWVTASMGCAPIFVFGMDCYTEGTYFHDPDAFSTGNRLDLKTHLNHWQQARKRLPRSYPIRFVGGPVPPIFPAYDPAEVAFPVVEYPDRLEALRGHVGKLVQVVRKPLRIGQEVFEVGDKIEINTRVVQHYLDRRQVVPVSVS